ncbi:hypothetical protein DFW101_3534 [Solidesulfovibrio carbinoliphilus subsp. oakridgensis]|uniref:Uncharacterized protein n=1 Tax=Solidesulfovibrio carbinoliphilus subsp. oakridgensis TaxID=694327 RepID=G7QC84_9BACT|nr:hypothetical protein [Solidesulfovibrio carbinoliphilus]EHJ49530.1 hypothetical protein DFW101_3534 [Solidesulfovibrio carbinoliphilus subsp. oakridgensis]
MRAIENTSGTYLVIGNRGLGIELQVVGEWATREQAQMVLDGLNMAAGYWYELFILAPGESTTFDPGLELAPYDDTACHNKPGDFLFDPTAPLA